MVKSLVLRRSSNDGLRWVAWANLFARAHPLADTGKLSLAHATHQITCVGALAGSAWARPAGEAMRDRYGGGCVAGA